MADNFKIGDVVCLSRAFLQSTQQFTGDAPFDDGPIVHIDDVYSTPSQSVKLLTVLWRIRGAGKVLSTNVILKSRKHLEPA